MIRALVPLRAPGAGKTRLASQFDTPARAALASAFAQDTVAALRGAGLHVAVVGSARPAFACDQWIECPDDGLNRALTYAVGTLDAAVPVIVTNADLPCLTSQDVLDVLSKLTGDRHHVPDAAGTGTTMAYARRADLFTPLFGEDSAAAFAASGSEPVDAPATARRDVDRAEDLRAALEIGVGRATAAALAALVDGQQ